MDGRQPGRGDPEPLACLALIARCHGIAADPAALRHALGLHGSDAIGVADLLRAARLLGLDARRVRSTPARLDKTPLPALAARRDGRWTVLARVAAGRVLVHDGAGSAPRSVDRAAFECVWNRELLLVRRRESPAGPGRRFGFAWFAPALWKYRYLLTEVLLASFVLQLFALVTPLFFQVVVDKVLVHGGLTTLDVLAAGFLVVAVFDALLGGLRSYVFAHTANRIDVTLGADLFRHLLRLPVAYFQARRVGDTVARVRELETLRQLITGTALTLCIDLLFTGVFFAVMWLYSPWLTAVVLAAVPAYLLLALLVTPVLRARLEEKFDRGADSQAYLVEAVSGIETLKAAAVEPQSARRWEDKLAGYVGASFRATQLVNVGGQCAALIQKLTVLGILWLGARQVLDGALTVGELVAFNLLAGRVAGPILRLAQLWQDFQQAGISMRRLGDILDAQPEPARAPGRGALPRIEGRIRFEHVGFRYRADGPEVLTDVSFEIRAGEVVGIVGPSGSGKSTLSRLVQRLHVPIAGRVLVDGVDLALVDTAWLRRQIGVVLQENVLFHRTVRENIALIDPSLALERVIQVARLAGAHEFILELPEGYDTIVGEHGATLSGGQRQRLAIARALISDPRVLIFDEATSALDYDAEATVHRNMRYIARGRSVLIIAHRLNAVRQAHRILVIDRGRVREAGTHAQLLASGGYYADMHRRQMA
ncbi:MAG: type I secretion system permease/ATPase [Gammaproteobacteria bacterium]|nr:type I secretion system permease/ATPase [Gammaproteobacteria bacterium]